MDNIFLSLNCYEEKTIAFSNLIKMFRVRDRDIYDKLMRFIRINKELLEYLKISIYVNQDENSITVSSNEFVGAISLRMPDNGLQGGDLQVYPRFIRSNSMSELCQLSSLLSYAIKPDVKENDLPLLCKNQMVVPLYHDAIKFIDLFYEAIKIKWSKFVVINNVSTYPKSSTNWDKYSRLSCYPSNVFHYPVRDSVMSQNHKEWQQLRYVFDLCKLIIFDKSCPNEIRYGYEQLIKIIDSLVYFINPTFVKEIKTSYSDPRPIKELKEQGNVILKNNSTVNYPWRIDCSSLFEKYVQHIVNLALVELNGRSLNNIHVNSLGQNPQWGLKYLEPDMVIKFRGKMIMADAKYKSYFMSYNWNNDKYKEEFRSDLHQLLAYCSFIDGKDKIGIFFCPTIDKYSCKKISYYFGESSVVSNVFIIALPFGVQEIQSNKDAIKDFLNNLM